MKSWVEPTDKEIKWLVCPIRECLIWICVKGRNEYTSAAETDIPVVTLPSQKLKSCQKLRLEGTIGKCTKAQWVATPQINTGLEVAEAALLSVSQTEIFFMRGANTAMKINGAIALDSTTGRRKFTARRWSALIGFFSVRTWKQVQNIWKQIEKAHDATEVRTIVVIAIK